MSRNSEKHAKNLDRGDFTPENSPQPTEQGKRSPSQGDTVYSVGNNQSKGDRQQSRSNRDGQIVNRSSGFLDDRPGEEEPAPPIPTDLSSNPIKILFSRQDIDPETNRPRWRWYIGGDRPIPTKIFTYIQPEPQDSNTEVETKTQAVMNNLGSQKNQYYVSLKHDILEENYPEDYQLPNLNQTLTHWMYRPRLDPARYQKIYQTSSKNRCDLQEKFCLFPRHHGWNELRYKEV